MAFQLCKGKQKRLGGGSTKFKGKVGGNIVNSREYSEIIGDESTDAAKNSLSVIADIKNKIIFGGNYFTDFLPASRCWIVWDKENTGNFADAELAWTSFDRGLNYIIGYGMVCRARVAGKRNLNQGFTQPKNQWGYLRRF